MSFNPTNFALTKLLIEDKTNNRKMVMNFDDFTKIMNKDYPGSVDIQLSPIVRDLPAVMSVEVRRCHESRDDAVSDDVVSNDAAMIRVALPFHLRNLAGVNGEVRLEVEAITVGSVSMRQARYPMLRGTMRDHVTQRRRAFLRFYACEQDLTHEKAAELPAARRSRLGSGAASDRRRGWLAASVPGAPGDVDHPRKAEAAGNARVQAWFAAPVRPVKSSLPGDFAGYPGSREHRVRVARRGHPTPDLYALPRRSCVAHTNGPTRLSGSSSANRLSSSASSSESDDER